MAQTPRTTQDVLDEARYRRGMSVAREYVLPRYLERYRARVWPGRPMGRHRSRVVTRAKQRRSW